MNQMQSNHHRSASDVRVKYSAHEVSSALAVGLD